MDTRWRPVNKRVIERAVIRRPDASDPALPDQIDSTSRLVMLALLALADVDGDIPADDQPSQSELADMTGVDKATVKRALNRLESAHWVIRHRPDPVKARTEYARTRYEVRHPTLGAGCAPSRRTARLDLGAQDATLGAGCAPSRRTARHLPLSEEKELLETSFVSEHADPAPTSGAPTPEDDPVPTEPGETEIPRPKTDRGTRLPEAWEPAVDLKHWTIAEGLTADEARREVDRFRDYWHSLSGARAVKKNWDATWRNWVRKAVDDKNRAKVRPLNRIDRNEQLLAEAASRIGPDGNFTRPFEAFAQGSTSQQPTFEQQGFPYIVIDGKTA